MTRTLLVCLAIWAIPDPTLGEDRFDVKDTSFEAECDGTVQRYVRLAPKEFDESQAHDLLVALHGHGSDRWQFVNATQYTGLASRNTAIKHKMIMVCPDYRAKTSWMGPSAEADVLQIIEELKKQYRIDQVFICGGSMGGSSALTFTAMHPELIAGVISINGTANHLEYSQFQDAISKSFGGTKRQIPQEYKKRSAEYWPERFTMPVGIAASGKDALVPPRSVLTLADVLKAMGRDVKLIYTEDRGHFTTHQDSEQLFDYVITKAKEDRCGK